MESLRKPFRRYAAWLEARAERHVLYASVLRAVAHRINHILDDHPESSVTEYGYSTDGGETVTPLTSFGDGSPLEGADIYIREATYTKWRKQ